MLFFFVLGFLFRKQKVLVLFFSSFIRLKCKYVSLIPEYVLCMCVKEQ